MTVDPSLLRDLLTIALGAATGVLSGMFGVGGAVISTPGIRALGAGPLTAVGTTLPSILPGAIAGTLRYRREGLIEWSAVALTVPPGIVAAIAGALLTRVIPGDGHLLQIATAALLGVSAYRMARPSDAAAPHSDDGDDHLRHRARYLGIGTVAGLLSGLLGIGGGVVMVPGFTQLTGMEVKRAIATSLACVGLFAVPGMITHAALGNIDWRFALLLSVGAVPGARLGASFTIAAADRKLRTTVAAFLAVTAVIYATGELIAL
jgi:uncharacterized membrane protein YfcA